MKRQLVDFYNVLNPPTGEIGIEIEYESLKGFRHKAVEGLRPEEVIPGWKHSFDGSLRLNGGELTLLTPVDEGEQKRELIESACKFVTKRREALPDSTRTSVHVHINVLNKTPLEIWTAACAYWLLEPLLFKFCGDSREGNLFCLRVSDAETLVAHAKKDIEREYPFSTIPPGKGDIIRYGGLNLGAVRTFGSLEFRGMRGCYDPEVLDKWTKCCRDLVKNACAYESPEHLLDMYYCTDKRDFLISLVGEVFADNLIELVPNYEELLTESVYPLLELAYEVDWAFWSKNKDEMRLPAAYLRPQLKAGLVPPLAEELDGFDD